MSSNPIGIFDSGIGGLSIWQEITTLLPHEDTIYLADSVNAPYGQKSKDEILHLCKKNTELLLKKNCKIIVVACNTATTNAISSLRKQYKVPFIGIEPAIKPAALKTKTNIIGILATLGTLNSSLFAESSKKYLEGITIIEQVGEGLVTLIEQGKINDHEIMTLLKTYLSPMLEKNIDCLVLGCTHYPFLIPVIETIIGKEISIIDSGLAVAKQTKAILEGNFLSNKNNKRGKHQIFSNKNISIIQNLISINNSTELILKKF